MEIAVRYEERHWYPDEGGVVWLAGYTVVDPESGSPLTLRRNPGNEHDPQAIAVLTAAGGQAGWVPRDVAPPVAADLDAGRPWSAVVLRERRASPHDPRSGLTMLLAPAATIELRDAGGR
jgi:hypothetical protein